MKRKRNKRDSKQEPLKRAMEEIRAVCRKHDLCAYIHLNSPDRAEYGFELDASWSCIRNEGPGAIRIRSQRDEYSSDEEQKRVVEASTGLVITLADSLQEHGKALEGLALSLGKQFGITHWHQELDDDQV